MQNIAHSALITELQSLQGVVRADANRADAATALSVDTVAALRDLGLFKLWVPQRYGGAELDLPHTLHLYEAAGRIDGSLGWAIMIGAGGGLFAAYLQDDAARELFSDRHALVAGSGAPHGTAVRVNGGYRASGRWKYASGAHYATIFTANCIVIQQGEPVLDENKQPLVRAMTFAPADVSIIPTWNALGMRGTGSHDFAVHDVFVPEARTFSVLTDSAREPGVLYRLPFDVLTQLPVAAVACGVAKHALDAFATLAATKKLTGTTTPLQQDAQVQATYASALARWRTVQLALHALASETWDTALAGQPLDAPQLADIAVCATHFVMQCLHCVQSLAGFAGMNASAMDEEFARAWRDLHTLASHASVSPLQQPAAGARLLAEHNPV